MFYLSQKFRKLIKPLALLLCLSKSIFILLINSVSLLRAEKIVVMYDGGFGHTVTCPEAVRRLYKLERKVFIMFEVSQFHNSYVRHLWKDMKVIVLPTFLITNTKNIAYTTGGLDQVTKKNVSRILIRLLRTYSCAQVMSHLELYKKLESIHHIKQVTKQYASVSWMPAWHKLVNEIAVQRTQLPAHIKKKIFERINKFNFSQHFKLCCIYLRNKEGDISSVLRIGSDFSEYIPSINYLIDKGHVILITGDRVINNKELIKFKGKVLTANYLRIDQNYFELFAATEADIWVGDTGGGNWLPVVNKIPMLVLNGFPYGFGIPNAFMMYKFIRNKKGKLASCKQMLQKHAYKFELPEMTVANNSSSDILNAVKIFLSIEEGVIKESEVCYDPKKLPDHALTKHVNTRLLNDARIVQ